MEKKTVIRFVFFSPAIGMVVGTIITIFLMYKEVVEADIITRWILAVGIPLVEVTFLENMLGDKKLVNIKIRTVS